MPKIQPGQRYINSEGITVDIHEIADGQVYFRQWPRGKRVMPWLEGLRRCPVEAAEREIRELGLKPVD